MVGDDEDTDSDDDSDDHDSDDHDSDDDDDDEEEEEEEEEEGGEEGGEEDGNHTDVEMLTLNFLRCCYDLVMPVGVNDEILSHVIGSFHWWHAFIGCMLDKLLHLFYCQPPHAKSRQLMMLIDFTKQWKSTHLITNRIKNYAF